MLFSLTVLAQVDLSTVQATFVLLLGTAHVAFRHLVALLPDFGAGTGLSARMAQLRAVRDMAWLLAGLLFGAYYLFAPIDLIEP